MIYASRNDEAQRRIDNAFSGGSVSGGAARVRRTIGQKDRWTERSDEKIAFLRTGLGVFPS